MTDFFDEDAAYDLGFTEWFQPSQTEPSAKLPPMPKAKKSPQQAKADVFKRELPHRNVFFSYEKLEKNYQANKALWKKERDRTEAVLKREVADEIDLTTADPARIVEITENLYQQKKFERDEALSKATQKLLQAKEAKDEFLKAGGLAYVKDWKSVLYSMDQKEQRRLYGFTVLSEEQYMLDNKLNEMQVEALIEKQAQAEGINLQDIEDDQVNQDLRDELWLKVPGVVDYGARNKAPKDEFSVLGELGKISRALVSAPMTAGAKTAWEGAKKYEERKSKDPTWVESKDEGLGAIKFGDVSVESIAGALHEGDITAKDFLEAAKAGMDAVKDSYDTTPNELSSFGHALRVAYLEPYVEARSKELREQNKEIDLDEVWADAEEAAQADRDNRGIYDVTQLLQNYPNAYDITMQIALDPLNFLPVEKLAGMGWKATKADKFGKVAGATARVTERNTRHVMRKLFNYAPEANFWDDIAANVGAKPVSEGVQNQAKAIADGIRANRSMGGKVMAKIQHRAGIELASFRKLKESDKYAAIDAALAGKASAELGDQGIKGGAALKRYMDTMEGLESIYKLDPKDGIKNTIKTIRSNYPNVRANDVLKTANKHLAKKVTENYEILNLGDVLTKEASKTGFISQISMSTLNPKLDVEMTRLTLDIKELEAHSTKLSGLLDDLDAAIPTLQDPTELRSLTTQRKQIIKARRRLGADINKQRTALKEAHKARNAVREQALDSIKSLNEEITGIPFVDSREMSEAQQRIVGKMFGDEAKHVDHVLPQAIFDVAKVIETTGLPVLSTSSDLLRDMWTATFGGLHNLWRGGVTVGNTKFAYKNASSAPWFAAMAHGADGLRPSNFKDAWELSTMGILQDKGKYLKKTLKLADGTPVKYDKVLDLLERTNSVGNLVERLSLETGGMFAAQGRLAKRGMDALAEIQSISDNPKIAAMLRGGGEQLENLGQWATDTTLNPYNLMQRFGRLKKHDFSLMGAAAQSENFQHTLTILPDIKKLTSRHLDKFGNFTEEAARIVNTSNALYAGDFGRKGVGKADWLLNNLMGFYSWARFIAPYTGRLLLRRPSVLGKMYNARRGYQDAMGEYSTYSGEGQSKWIKEQFGIPDVMSVVNQRMAEAADKYIPKDRTRKRLQKALRGEAGYTLEDSYQDFGHWKMGDNTFASMVLEFTPFAGLAYVPNIETVGKNEDLLKMSGLFLNLAIESMTGEDQFGRKSGFKQALGNKVADVAFQGYTRPAFTATDYFHKLKEAQMHHATDFDEDWWMYEQQKANAMLFNQLGYLALPVSMGVRHAAGMRGLETFPALHGLGVTRDYLDKPHTTLGFSLREKSPSHFGGGHSKIGRGSGTEQRVINKLFDREVDLEE